MIAAVIAVATALLAITGLAVFLAIRNDRRVSDLIDAMHRLDLAKDEFRAKLVEAERATFERDKLAEVLKSEQRRGDALEEFISHDAHTTDPNADLAPDDVAGRLLQFTRTMSGRQAARDTIPAEPVGEVHSEPAAGIPGDARLPESF